MSSWSHTGRHGAPCRHLKPFRAHKIYEVSGAEVRAIRNAYMEWIAGAQKTGWATITFGVHTGGHCNLDETIAPYGGSPLKRVARINAEQAYTHGYLLREFTIGKEDLSRGRVIGTGWAASNCTSNWNGNILRIDLLHRQTVENALQEGVGAFSGGEMRISTDEDTVTFTYTAGTGDDAVLTRDALARYRIQGGRAIRVAPLAPSFAGFIDEWLNMEDAEAARWSSPEAARQHHALAEQKGGHIFTWEHAATCVDYFFSPPLDTQSGAEFVVWRSNRFSCAAWCWTWRML